MAPPSHNWVRRGFHEDPREYEIVARVVPRYLGNSDHDGQTSAADFACLGFREVPRDSLRG
jgi:hypothetical protein